MLALAKIALWAWPPIVLIVFACLRPARRAVLVAYLGAWLFLPYANIRLSAVFELTKFSAPAVGVLLGMVLFDIRTLLKFRPKWYDLPALLWCVTPYFTSMANDLGTVDGVSSMSSQLFVWGIPYFVGRCYFTDWESFRELGIAVFIGGLLYVPLCLIEWRMSPFLHKRIYGFYAHPVAQEARGTSYRPQVFMFSGLSVSMWMGTACIMGVWLWATGALKRLASVPMFLLLPVLLGTTVLCKSSGALVLTAGGMGALFAMKWFRNPLPLVVLLLASPLYMYERASQNWDGEWAKDHATKYFGEDRGKSFATRIDAENKLTARAFEAPNPWLGWGKWDKNNPIKVPWRIQEEVLKILPSGEQYIRLRDTDPTDGLWVITLGQFGLSGLIAVTVTLLLPPLVLLMRVPSRLWGHPIVAPVAALAITLPLHMADNLMNAIPDPMYLIAAGGICGIGPSLRKWYRAQKQAAAAGVTTVTTPASLGAGAGSGSRPVGASPSRPVASPVVPEGFPAIPGLRTPSVPYRR